MTGFAPQVSASKKAMQVRFFHNQSLEELQRQVNDWLAEQPHREIAEIKQSVGQAILISIWYMD